MYFFATCIFTLHLLTEVGVSYLFFSFLVSTYFFLSYIHSVSVYKKRCKIFNSGVFTTLKSLVHEQGGYAVFLLLREYLFIRDFRVFKGIDFSKWGSRTLTTKENGLFINLFDEEKLFDLVESWSLLKKLRTKFIENCIPFIMKKIVNKS